MTGGTTPWAATDVSGVSGRADVVWMLLAFVVTTVVTRVVTRSIRARAARPQPADRPSLVKNVHIGGVHVHHQVWGILLVLVIGLLEITYRPSGVAAAVFAALFGVGAALTLDEFAMWLHVDDVYWSEQGRKSISALLLAAAIAVGLILGSDPLDLNADTSPAGSIGPWLIVIDVVIGLVLAVVCVLKGKLLLGILGVFVPVVSLFGAVRLAKPDSWWARRRYPAGGRRARRAAARFGEAYERRWRRVTDFVGGAPTAAPPAAPTAPPAGAPTALPTGAPTADEAGGAPGRVRREPAEPGPRT